MGPGRFFVRQLKVHPGPSSRPCLDPNNSACMISITKMTGLGVLLTRGCCSLKDKNYFGPRCMEGKTMETEYGSVKETNCVQENCNKGSLEGEGTTARQQKQQEQRQQIQVIRWSLSRFCTRFTG